MRKVVPSRITAMAFHPSSEKTIVCAGDKYGNIGFWNVVSVNIRGDIRELKQATFLTTRTAVGSESSRGE